MSNASKTINPPNRAHRPGSSPITNQTTTGARTDSNKISSATSGALINLGPIANKQVPNAIHKPCPK